MHHVRQENLPLVGSSYDFVGADQGDTNVSVFLFYGKPGAGPGPHRHAGRSGEQLLNHDVIRSILAKTGLKPRLEAAHGNRHVLIVVRRQEQGTPDVGEMLDVPGTVQQPLDQALPLVGSSIF